MKTFATVISVTEKYALVEADRVSACEGCHKATEEDGCSVCTLMGGSRKFSAKAENTLGAKVGDRVVIESSTRRLLAYAALVFLLPLFGAATVYGVLSRINVGSSLCLLGAFAGFAGTFFGVFAYSEIVRKKHYDVKITEICFDQISDMEKIM